MQPDASRGSAKRADSPSHNPLAEALRFLAVMWACLPAIQPLFVPGLPNTHDGEGHLFRLLDFDLTWRAGAFFPRIAPHLALDYGYATFTFYSPTSLYLGETFHLFGLGYIAALKACFAASIVSSGLGAYLLGRELYGTRGAMLAALVYVYLPYHLLDVYTRGDIAETLALGLLPFVVWSFWRLARAPSTGRIVAAAVFLTGLVVTHNLSAMLLVPVLPVFLLVAINRDRSRHAIGAIALAGLLALTLSAFYWLPVLGQLGDINTAALTTGFFDYHQRF
ncbi:MAG TPA: 6-pyruvoyl-tetrahydropterin synthase-related protein, partial [Chloroflexota bacterium]|nr:6-pyruvoyl-tetrahydropterin synthase-related protein [Chloroflexota bacterium]